MRVGLPSWQCSQSALVPVESSLICSSLEFFLPRFPLNAAGVAVSVGHQGKEGGIRGMDATLIADYEATLDGGATIFQS